MPVQNPGSRRRSGFVDETLHGQAGLRLGFRLALFAACDAPLHAVDQPPSNDAFLQRWWYFSGGDA